MVGPGDVDDDLEPETAEECAKYGKVVKCIIFEVGFHPLFTTLLPNVGLMFDKAEMHDGNGLSIFCFLMIQLASFPDSRRAGRGRSCANFRGVREDGGSHQRCVSPHHMLIPETNPTQVSIIFRTE